MAADCWINIQGLESWKSFSDSLAARLCVIWALPIRVSCESAGRQPGQRQGGAWFHGMSYVEDAVLELAEMAPLLGSETS